MEKKTFADYGLHYVCKVIYHGTCVATGAFATIDECVDWVQNSVYDTIAIHALDRD